MRSCILSAVDELPIMIPWFLATRRFTFEDGEAWGRYFRFSGLTQLREVVTLDNSLCPKLLSQTKSEYWPYVVNDDFLTDFFTDFDFLLKQVAHIENKNILCVFRNPSEKPVAPKVATFEFLGYDLVDVKGGVSALTNCGGFPDVFPNSELSIYGLLPTLNRANEVASSLRLFHPKERHAQCDVWALSRMIQD